MNFRLSFSLLASLVCIAITNHATEARPTKRGSVVTLPLQRIRQVDGDVHPQILLQQHMNLGQRRLAKLQGRDGPSTEELTAKISKRMAVLSTEPDAGLSRKSKRYNRQGIPGGTVPQSEISIVLASNNNGGKDDGDDSEGFTAANTPTTQNSLGLDIIGSDVGYFATIQMGTPPRDFRILMDSGSADLWVGAENCQSEAGGGCGNHVFLGSESSSSFADQQKPFKITYGTGNVNGTIIQDDISVAGLQLSGHTFGVAQFESIDFAGNNVVIDGLMGLAKSGLSEQKTLTPVESLAQQGLIREAITSFKISRLADQDNDGEVSFGGLDASKFDPNTLTTVTNVNQDGFWEAKMNGTTVNGVAANVKILDVILDTGTTLMIAPAADAAAVHSLIDGAASDGHGGFTIPCTTNASVALVFGGNSFAIDPRDLTFAPVNPNDPTGNCISSISSGGQNDNSWLAGDTFLKNAYFSTNVDENTISLAKLI